MRGEASPRFRIYEALIVPIEGLIGFQNPIRLLVRGACGSGSYGSSWQAGASHSGSARMMLPSTTAQRVWNSVIKHSRYLFLFQNRKIEVVRWLVRLCMDRNLISDRQFLFSAKGLEECGRMVGGWARSLNSTNDGEGNKMRT